ncbi:poly-beta-1,6-N-acetyl-D-glucosamine biosynthesis protein PgaD [Pseudomonas gingeri]|uniref:poly-beta-1,6-N-acetyl-D-glucosamine biosynthesis protein PgaD n=1 Tax=Pseudomonas gingeri TaxID=117681 RepID=UPI0015A3CC30|nr:poly-beta-1,6-N-acetyl-D-glucosamine biosynthesis protein PgaD [Pseudomonas gingeri]NWA04953.1 poly-beta-1,6-N-acetyl-D-glucosamine biosynthesis protein PgaD [Pseudomonas gingeri]NWA17750.1 poly-beta-1,6-N-acetyl-D-glucosamine biosynthesis protein PgaD [Pseudomonas gingeri]NWA59192.1 poly-beta-1,6-N-acetyl-D-glucosamine biosynthesis protein PgaD [Pseudomonas gingeri]NWA99388.1 poly-beta-1,6-N-acetyl-D-glucosamine biosynthesis protein PgaD [Pseudomonas gingeri]NWB04610.1 poly-beta-1,6-N-acet
MKIIRTRQRPFMAIVDAVLTLLAWIGLLYLLIQGLWPLLDGHAGPRIDISFFDALNTLQIYLWIGLLNAALLIAWARYQQRKSRSYSQRRLPAPVVGDEGLSRSFKLSDDNFARMRQSATMIVHNDEYGGVSEVITHLYRVEPDEQPQPLAPPAHPRVIRLPSDDDGKAG